VSPAEAVAAFRRLGAEVIPGRGKGNHTWMERLDDQGRRVAIFNVPMNRNPVPTGLFLKDLLRRNGIHDVAHLKLLLNAPDPPAAFLEAVMAHRAAGR